jgi:hypothetical protein
MTSCVFKHLFGRKVATRNLQVFKWAVKRFSVRQKGRLLLEGAPGHQVCAEEKLSVVIMVVIVVVVIPVTISVPTVIVFTPPTMAVLPAIFTGFVKFTTVFGRFRAVPAVVFYGFMQPVIGPCDTLLAIILIGTEGRRAEGEEERAEGCSSEDSFGQLPIKTIIGDHVFSKLICKRRRARRAKSMLGVMTLTSQRAFAVPD